MEGVESDGEEVVVWRRGLVSCGLVKELARVEGVVLCLLGTLNVAERVT